MSTALWVIFGLASAISLWVRFAPTRVEEWHVDPTDIPNPRPRGYKTKITVSGAPEDALSMLAKITGTYPRTRIFAGSPESGRITFVSYSALWGFPDYTTVQAKLENEETQLIFLGRQRYGIGDSATNVKRIKSWIKALEAVLE